METKENVLNESKNETKAMGESKQISSYKGFAYTKNSEQARVVYGNTKEDILARLQEWNKTRTEGNTYDTCNIGKLNQDTGKHENYQKFDVETGKNITKIYLHDAFKTKVAIESTADYSEKDFQTNMYNKKGFGKEEYYRVVKIGEKGTLEPVNGRVFTSKEDVRDFIRENTDLVYVPYDELVNNAHPNRNNNKESVLNQSIEYYTQNLGGTGLGEDSTPLMHKDFQTALDSYLKAEVDGKRLGVIIDDENVQLASFDAVINANSYVHNLYGAGAADQTIQANLKTLQEECIKDNAYHSLYSGFSEVSTGACSAMIGQKSEWGAWIGHIVNNYRPQDYIEVEIMGYSKQHKVSYSVDVIQENKIVDSKMFTASTDIADFENSIRKINEMAHKEFDGYIKNAVSALKVEQESTYYVYSSLSNMTLKEHHEQLERAGYEKIAQKQQPKEVSTYRGFAYMKNNDQAQMVYGNSQEDILARLQEWNKNRTPENAYVTCNIGKLNPETGKHENYQKFDVSTGQNISKIYLEIPKGITKQEFNDTIAYFKEHGARFSGIKKQWYINPGQEEGFKEYLGNNSEKEQKTSAQENQEKTAVVEQPQEADTQGREQPIFDDVNQEMVEEIKSDADKAAEETERPSALEFIAGIDNEYVIDLKNGETVRLNESEMLERAGATSMDEISNVQRVEVIEEKVQEHLNGMQGKSEYEFSVSSEVAVSDTSKIENSQVELKEGDKATFYIPEYQTSSSGIREISGIKEISGELQKVETDKYTIRTDEGKLTEVQRNELYDERQSEIMKRAVSKEYNPEQMDLIGNPKLSAAQMEQVLNGIQDGLSNHQVAMYANPSIPTWQMDTYRYGMDNGISFENIKGVVDNNAMKATNWEDSRNMVNKMVKAQRNLIIKDLKENNLVPEKQLVKKIEKLNGKTGRMHTVKDIKGMLKERSGDEAFLNSENGKLMKDIGKDVNHQKMKMSKAQSATPQIACR